MESVLVWFLETSSSQSSVSVIVCELQNLSVLLSPRQRVQLAVQSDSWPHPPHWDNGGSLWYLSISILDQNVRLKFACKVRTKYLAGKIIQSFKMTCWHPAFTRSVFLGLILIALDFMLKSLDPETHYMQSWKGGTLVHRINLGWYDFLQLNTLRLSKSRSVGICSRPMETKSKTLIRCLGIHHKFDIYHAIVS